MKALITLFLILFAFSGCESIRKHYEKQRQAQYDYYVDYCNLNYGFKGEYVVQRCIDRKWDNHLLREQLSDLNRSLSSPNYIYIR